MHHLKTSIKMIKQEFQLLNTLKNYNYLDFEDRLHIADAIILNFDGDNIKHPFRENKPSKHYRKVIQFPTKEHKF